MSRFVRWHVAGSDSAGFVRRDRLTLVLAEPTPLRQNADRIELLASDFTIASAQMAALCARLHASGALALHGEIYPVTSDFTAPPLLQLDRGAVPFFGVRPFGVHLCAFVRRPDGLHVWVAVRAKGRTFAGCWDNTVAGGQPIGLSLRANLQKECAEEASMPSELAARAIATDTLTYVREDATGLKPDTLFCFDLEVPATFVPRPHDSEVERFLLLPIRELAAAVRDRTVCKPNCALVWIAFLLRHGVLDTELSPQQRTMLAASLRTRLP